MAAVVSLGNLCTCNFSCPLPFSESGHGDESPMMDGVDLGVATVVQGLDLGLTGQNMSSMFLFLFLRINFSCRST
jgi:hypothetical protein